jgi:hypothetical protein
MSLLPIFAGDCCVPGHRQLAAWGCNVDLDMFVICVMVGVLVFFLQETELFIMMVGQVKN